MVREQEAIAFVQVEEMEKKGWLGESETMNRPWQVIECEAIGQERGNR